MAIIKKIVVLYGGLSEVEVNDLPYDRTRRMRRETDEMIR